MTTYPSVGPRATDRPWFLDHFKPGRRAPRGSWRAFCPLCGKRGRLSISPGDGQWVMNCYGANGEKLHIQEVLASRDLTFADLRYGKRRKRAQSRREIGRAGTDRTPSPTRPYGDVSHPSYHGTGLPEVEELIEMAQRREIAPAWKPGRKLPKATPSAARKVFNFYVLVRGVRLAACDDRPVPFACDWVSKWTRLPTMTVHRAIKWLLQAGFLEHTETLPGRDKRGTFAYLPGALVDFEDAVGGSDETAQPLLVKPALHADSPHLERDVISEEVLPNAEFVGAPEAPGAIVGAVVGSLVAGSVPALGDGSVHRGPLIRDRTITESPAKRPDVVHAGQGYAVQRSSSWVDLPPTPPEAAVWFEEFFSRPLGGTPV